MLIRGPLSPNKPSGVNIAKDDEKKPNRPKFFGPRYLITSELIIIKSIILKPLSNKNEDIYSIIFFYYLKRFGHRSYHLFFF